MYSELNNWSSKMNTDFDNTINNVALSIQAIQYIYILTQKNKNIRDK